MEIEMELYRILFENKIVAVIATKNYEQAVAFMQGRFNADVNLERISPELTLNSGLVAELYIDKSK